MVCNTNTSEIRLEACNVSWGKREKTCITPAADVTGSLNSTSFNIDSTNTSFYAWLNVNSLGIDPAPAGKTGIEIAIPTDETAANIAIALKAAVELEDFYADISIDGLSVEVYPKEVGAVVATVDVDSTFAFAQEVEGIGGSLGRTSEGIEVSFETTSFEVKANQSGENLIDEIKTGNVLNCSMNLLEMSKEKWNLIVGNGLGDKLTPAGGTEFIGFGSSKDYKSMLDLAGELVLKPVGAIDNSRNFTFWKSLPKPSSINFSGTDLQVMNIEFSAYIDPSKDTKINLGGFGDNAQDFRA